MTQAEFNQMLQTAIAQGAVGGYYTSKYSGEEIDQRLDGSSIYDYAVEGGYTGTEAEFQALMGSGPWVHLSDNAGAHNAIYRGKYLGDTYTAAQQAEVAAGTFHDLYIGDYWTISGINYRIAGFDYYINTGDTACTTHHIIVVPDTVLYTHAMNDTITTAGGYFSSLMRTSGLESAKTMASAAFGVGHILSHRVYLSNSVSDNVVYGGIWDDGDVELMNEVMVYGHSVFLHWSLRNWTASKGQLPLFNFRHDLIGNRQDWWLRDVVNNEEFTYCNQECSQDHRIANAGYGVRPEIPVC